MIIEKNIPLAKKTKQDIPFEKMEVGDSIYFQKPEKEDYRSFHGKISSKATYFVSRHQHTWKFSCRQVDINGLRVWRVK